MLLIVVDCLKLCEAVGDSLNYSTDINLPSLLHLTFLYYFYALCDALRPILLSSKEMDIWKLRWIQQMLLHLDESLYVVEDYWCCDSHGRPWESPCGGRHVDLEAVASTLTHILPPRDPPGRAAAARKLNKYVLILRLSECQSLIVLINNSIYCPW